MAAPLSTIAGAFMGMSLAGARKAARERPVAMAKAPPWSIQ